MSTCSITPGPTIRRDEAMEEVWTIKERLWGEVPHLPTADAVRERARRAADLRVWEQITTEFDVDIFCGLFLEDWNRGFDLDPHLLHMLGERGITLRFDIYSPDSP